MNAATPVPSIFDMQSLSSLQRGVRQDDPQALKATAQQFEALFLQMVLDSMRAATPQDGPFESEQTRFYHKLFDQQLAQTLAARGTTGLAAMIERQLAGKGEASAGHPAGLPLSPQATAMPLTIMANRPPAKDGTPRHDRSTLSTTDTAIPISRPAAVPLSPPVDAAVALPPTGAVLPADTPAARFAAAVWPYAVAASRTTGIPPQFLLAHAALESGWGRHEPRFADGRPSHNLFGIKAGGNWQGDAVQARTTEYVAGVAEQRVERFRAYASYAESFRDYARLLSESPRYAGVLGSRDSAAFAYGLQRAGYATDPAYAAKLEGIIHGPTLRQALIG